MSTAKTKVIATFPPGYFLENIEILHDGGILIGVMNRSEIYYLPPPSIESHQVSPILLQSFPSDQNPFGVVRAPQNPNVVYFVVSDFLAAGSKKSHLYVLDFSNPALGVRAVNIMTFPDETQSLNGMCALSDSVLIVADSFGECIWRVDLDLSSFPPQDAKAEKWLSDETMAGKLVLPDFQPGTNGLKYCAKTNCAYYTSTQKRLFCRVHVDPESLRAVGDVEIITRGMPGDDLIIDDEYPGGPVAYLTTHRDSTILRVPLESSSEIDIAQLDVVVRGSTEDQTVLGPTAGVWAPGKKGKTAFFTFDGGLKNPLEDGAVRSARVVQVDFS